MKISLTIDNGPTPGVTEQVLGVLRRRDVKATFFVLGARLGSVEERGLVERAKDEGHRIGNHTFSHSVLFGVEPDQSRVLSEIDETQAMLGELGEERLFRPFGGGGHLDSRVMSRTGYEHLRDNGYTLVLWNSIPGDWINPDGWPEVAMRQAADQGWAVPVLHDLPTGAMRHLDRFIGMARNAGAEFVEDFPAAITPLIAGRPAFPMDALITER